FEAVDAMVWLGADPSELRPDSLAAVEDYVHGGRRLVVCQGANWQKRKESQLPALLPVDLQGLIDEKDAKSLRILAGISDFEALDKKNKLDPTWTIDDRDTQRARPT